MDDKETNKNEDYQIYPILKDPEEQEYIPIGDRLLKPPFVYALIGTRMVGKTTLMMSLTMREYPFYLGAFDRIILISPTLGVDTSTRELVNYIGEENTFDFYDDGIIDGIIAHNKNLPKPMREKILVIGDDLPAMGIPMNAKIYTTLSCAGRHYGISTMLISQILRGNNIGLPPACRNNIEGYFIFRNSNQKQLNNIFEELGHFGSPSNIEAMYNDVVGGKPYQFLYLNSRNLTAHRNLDEEIWSMYDENGNYNQEYNKMKKNKMLDNNIKDEPSRPTSPTVQ
jgi:hypothetical protein